MRHRDRLRQTRLVHALLRRGRLREVEDLLDHIERTLAREAAMDGDGGNSAEQPSGERYDDIEW